VSAGPPHASPSRSVSEGIPVLSRIKTPHGIEQLWRDLASKIYSPRVLQGLPSYIGKIAFVFWDEDPTTIPSAIRNGDVATFIAFLIRLDQIERAMIDVGRDSLAERAPVIYARQVVDGMREAAEARLLKKGGVWPPTPGG